MRELFKEVVIGGITIPIYFDDEDDMIQEGALGYTEFAADSTEIVLNPDLKERPDLFATTLWHELFHMISNVYSLNFDEQDVSVLSVAVVELQNAFGDPRKKVKKLK